MRPPTTMAAAAELEEAMLTAGTALTAKTPSTGEHVLQPCTSQELGSAHKSGLHPSLLSVYLNTYCWECVPAEG